MSAKPRILECARDLYVSEGLRGLSLRQVARRAGVSAPAIYKHFASKEALLLEVAREGHAVFAGYLARGLKGRTPAERLIRTGEGYLDFALEHRAFYLVMFVAPPEHLGYDKLARQNDDEGAATFQMLVDRVAECMSAGVLDRADPVEASLVIWAHVHGMVTLYFQMPAHAEHAHLGAPQVADEASFRRLYRRGLDVLLSGFGLETPG